MSEYECINGHPMLPSEGLWCPVCGERAYYEDGHPADRDWAGEIWDYEDDYEPVSGTITEDDW